MKEAALGEQERTVARPNPGGRATTLSCITSSGFVKYSAGSVESGLARLRGRLSGRLGGLLDLSGRFLGTRDSHNRGVHATDLPLDEVQMGPGPGTLVLGHGQLQADAVTHVQAGSLALVLDEADQVARLPVGAGSAGLPPLAQGLRERIQLPGPGVGSSPLARGLHTHHQRLDRYDGIIPARAGFTRTHSWRARPGPDHPRSRGVYQLDGDKIRQEYGSSPLARGLPPSRGVITVSVRIIPARAGFTGPRSSRPEGMQDHPRVKSFGVV